MTTPTGVLFQNPIVKPLSSNATFMSGCTATFYLTGTTTLANIYADGALTSPLANPLTADASGTFVPVYYDPNIIYRVVIKTSAGVVVSDTDPVIPSAISGLTQSGIGRLLWGQSSAELAAGITPTNFGYPWGWAQRYGFSGDGGVTDNSTPLQNAINANAGAYPVFIPNMGGYAKVAGRFTVPANTHIHFEDGAELRWASTTATGVSWLGSASRPGLEVQGDNFLITGKGKLTGPGTAAANSGAGGGGVTAIVSNECAIIRVGASAASRGTGFTVRDVEISLWGQMGIATQFMQDIKILDCVIHDIGYQGITNLSNQNVREHRNKIYGIAPGINGGSGFNAYGMQHTHDSTNYASDPNATAAPRQTVNPFCIDVDVGYNEIRDVPAWNGIDFHGGYECRVHNNVVYNCHRGIQLSGSSGSAINFAGEDNYIIDNVIYGSQINGNATTDTSGFQAGCVVNGGSTLTHRGIIVRGNHFYNVGHASATPSVFVIEASFCSGVVIQGNTFHACVGRMIYMSNTQGTIKDNFLDSLGSSATGSNFLYIDSNCGPLSITGNIHSPTSGTLTACTNGLNTPGSGYARMTVCGNDFSACTNPYVNFGGLLTRNTSDVTPAIADATTGSHTIDVSVVGQAPRFIIQATQTGAATLTSLLNPQLVGQKAEIVMTGSSTLTVNNSGNIKLQGGSRALTSSSELTLVWDGTKWQEQCCTIGNT